MTGDELREVLAEGLIRDTRTRGFVGIRAVTDALLPVVAALIDKARAEGREQGRGDMEALERQWRAEELEAAADKARRLTPDVEAFLRVRAAAIREGLADGS